MYRVEYYTRQNGRSPVKEYLSRLPKKHRAKALRFIELLAEKNGVLPRQYVAPVEGRIKELRIKHSPFQFRIFFTIVINKKIILLHAITKKTQALKRKDIEQAIANLKDYRQRY